MEYISFFINWAIQILILVVIIDVVLSYLMPDQNHPVRVFIHRIIEPLLSPIRKLLPQSSGIDFSPMILILILIIFQYLLGAILRSFG
jgi:YggT family protein